MSQEMLDYWREHPPAPSAEVSLLCAAFALIRRALFEIAAGTAEPERTATEALRQAGGILQEML